MAFPATGTAAPPAYDPARHLRVAMRRQVRLMLGVVVAVVYVDQVSKAWAWRHLADVHVNSGGDLLVSTAVSSLLRDRVSGALLDVADAALIVAALLLLARRHRPPGVLPAASLLLAGWISNLADRLGMHFWTAPGSVRGAVDFLPFAGYEWNLADLAIIVGTLGLLTASALAAVRALSGRRRMPGPVRRPLSRPWVQAVLITGVVAVAALAVLGAQADGYGDSPAAVLAARSQLP